MGSLSLLQESSQSRDQAQVSHIGGRFFTSWAMREASIFKTGAIGSGYRSVSGWKVSVPPDSEHPQLPPQLSVSASFLRLFNGV